MNYADLIRFEPVDSVIQLREADETSEAKRLVETFVISDTMAERLIDLVFKQLRLDLPGDSKGLLVVGNYGTGKSHLMALVSAIAEHADLGSAVTHAAVASEAQAVAGRFKVMRREIGSTTMSLQDIVCSFMDEKLEALGVRYQFPPASEVASHKDPFDAMMAEFEAVHPNQGLLLVVDELLDYLRTRSETELIGDLNFLRELGEICQSTRFRFIAGVQESLFDSGRFQFVAASLRRVRDRFEQVRIARQDVAYVVSQRLLKKTPKQRGWIREHLEGFAPLYGAMNEQMEAFVDLYPVHPSYLDTFERIRVAEKREVLKTLSAAIRRLSEREVPADEPGVVAYDSYWAELKDNPSFRSIPEIREVIDKSKVLEDKIQNGLRRPQYKAIALRIIHALSVHRLTTDDIYARLGVTAEELRDDLCLILSMPEKDAAFLKSLVERVFQDIHSTVNGQFITANQENGQFYLDLKKDVDFNALIKRKAETLGDEDLDRHYFSALARLLEASEETHVPDYKIWEHELVWRAHRAERSGYLFFGAPNERSTAQPPRDFYLYFLQPYVRADYQDDKKPDEVFFTLKRGDSEFDERIALYAGARLLAATASGENRRTYEEKADEHLVWLARWLRKHMATSYEVTCEGRSGVLQELVRREIKDGLDQLSARELVNAAGSAALASHFKNKSPNYPAFGVLITRANRDQAVGEALRWLAGGVKSNQGTAVLEALELLDGDQLSPRKSRYAKHVLEMLHGKPQGKVLNRSELVQEDAGIAYWKRFRLEPEFLTVVLAALVHSGALVLSLPGRKLDAADVNQFSRIPVNEFVAFKHVERPKGFPLETLRQLFVDLDLAEGLLVNEGKREEAVKSLQLEVNKRLEQTVKAQETLKNGLVFWGSPVLLEPENADWMARVGQTKQFLESLQRFDSVGKLNNFAHDAAELDVQKRGLARLKEVDDLAGLIAETGGLTSYLALAEAVLPQEHDWRKTARQTKEELLTEFSDPARRVSDDFRIKLRNALKDLKVRYQDAYLELHGKAHLGFEDDRKKVALNQRDHRLKQLRALDKVDIMPHHQLKSFQDDLLGLPTCFALSRRDLEATPLCPHTQYRPAENPPKSLSASQILAGLDERLDDLVQGWTSTLLRDLEDPTVSANIELISNLAGKGELAEFRKTGTLPEQISSDFVEVTQEALTGLEKVSVDRASLCAALVEGGIPCTIDELQRRFAAYVAGLTEDKDQNKVRVVVE